MINNFIVFQKISATNYQRDGFMQLHNQNGAPNYFPNSFSGPKECPAVRAPSFSVSGDVDRYHPVDEDDFGQVTNFWKNVLDSGAKTRLVDNMVDNLTRAQAFIIERAVKNFSEVDVELGKRLTEGLHKKGIKINIFGKAANLWKEYILFFFNSNHHCLTLCTHHVIVNILHE